MKDLPNITIRWIIFNFVLSRHIHWERKSHEDWITDETQQIVQVTLLINDYCIKKYLTEFLIIEKQYVVQIIRHATGHGW